MLQCAEGIRPFCAPAFGRVQWCDFHWTAQRRLSIFFSVFHVKNEAQVNHPSSTLAEDSLLVWKSNFLAFFSFGNDFEWRCLRNKPLGWWWPTTSRKLHQQYLSKCNSSVESDGLSMVACWRIGIQHSSSSLETFHLANSRRHIQ